ncbi:MAG TPA: hypothetical protein QF753_12560 [Victivallales bacterium]|nr:hypothetical protein [Victivallales bacterium]
MKKFIKYLLIVICIIVVVLVACLISVYFKYRSIEKQNLPAKYEKTVVTPKKEVFLGTPVDYKLFFSTPWNKEPVSAEVILGKGSQLIGKPIVTKSSNKWGYFVWEIAFKVQPFVDGTIPEGALKVDFASNNYGVQNLTVKYPSITSKKITSIDNQLLVASKMKAEKLISESNVLFYSIIAAIVLICLIIFLLIYLKKRKGQNQIILTPWGLAIQSLNSLNRSFSSHEISPGKCMIMLTDIVREYLESRFSIHAQRQTTEEFLRKMEDRDSPLENQDRNFLKEFMMSADMVKFAKYDASEELINNSIDRASKLVTETIPDEEADKNND